MRTTDNSKHVIRNCPDIVIDRVRHLQELRSSHSSLLLCQPVQFLQRIPNIVLSHQFLHIFF